MFDDISIGVNDIIDQPEALIAASKFAERFDAVLNGYYLKLDAAEVWRWQSSNPMALANQLLIDEEQREENLHAEFDAITKQYDCRTHWHVLNQSNSPVSWMMCSDVIFTNQPTTNAQPSFVGSTTYLSQLIIETRRPVLMIPQGWSQNRIGERILLGWNSSPEAMRAASDAVPLLRQADEVLVIDIVKDHIFAEQLDNSPGIEDYLKRKEVDYQLLVKHAANGRQGVASVFSKTAADNNIDLIVVGGYGHSRLRELVLGGMTKHLIHNSIIPVLFSH